MKKPDTPANELERLAKLHEFQVLDTPAEPAFDALTALAAYIVGVPIALVSLVDTNRQWFKSRYGLDAPETPRDISFCGHVVASETSLVVGDAFADERFFDNPLVTGEPRVRFYAGIPLSTSDGFVLGTLCAIDHEPRQLSQVQQDMLTLLAKQVVDQLELRRRTLLLRDQRKYLTKMLDEATQRAEQLAEVTSQLQSILVSANTAVIETTPDGIIRVFNPAAERMLGYSASELVGLQSPALFHDPAEVQACAVELSRELGVTIDPGFEVFVAKPKRGIPYERDWTYIRKDGTRLSVTLSITARSDASGQIVGFLGIASDITARKQAETALENRASLLKLGADTARAFASDTGLSNMLQNCAEAVVTNLHAAFARIWTFNEAENMLELKASAGQYAHVNGLHARIPIGECKIGKIARARTPHVTNSVLGDPLVEDQEWARTGRENRMRFRRRRV